MRTLVASPTMAFERQTAVRAAGRSSTAVKVVVLFELRQPKFSIMSVSLQCKKPLLVSPVPFLVYLGYSLKVFELALPLLFLSFLLFFLSCLLSQTFSINNTAAHHTPSSPVAREANIMAKLACLPISIHTRSILSFPLPSVFFHKPTGPNWASNQK